MKPTVIFACCLASLPFLCGCLEYEEQTMSFRYEPDDDVLHIFQDYRGIFGGDDSSQLSDAEKHQMASVLEGGRMFFFNNWITEFNRAQLQEMKNKPPGELEDDPAYEAAIRATVEAALTNIQVENVGFYYDNRQRLCGAQRVTMRNASKVLNAVNEVLPFVMREEMMEEDKSSEEERLVRRFADSGRKVLTLNGNRLEIHWPVTQSDFQEAKEKSRLCRAFQDSGGQIDYADGAVVLTIGNRDAVWTALNLPFSEKAYTGNAVTEAENHGIRKSFDAEAAAREFLNSKTTSK